VASARKRPTRSGPVALLTGVLLHQKPSLGPRWCGAVWFDPTGPVPLTLPHAAAAAACSRVTAPGPTRPPSAAEQSLVAFNLLFIASSLPAVARPTTRHPRTLDGGRVCRGLLFRTSLPSSYRLHASALPSGRMEWRTSTEQLPEIRELHRAPSNMGRRQDAGTHPRLCHRVELSGWGCVSSGHAISLRLLIKGEKSHSDLKRQDSSLSHGETHTVPVIKGRRVTRGWQAGQRASSSSGSDDGGTWVRRQWCVSCLAEEEEEFFNEIRSDHMAFINTIIGLSHPTVLPRAQRPRDRLASKGRCRRRCRALACSSPAARGACASKRMGNGE